MNAFIFNLRALEESDGTSNMLKYITELTFVNKSVLCYEIKNRNADRGIFPDVY